MEWNEMEWNEMKWDEMVRNGTKITFHCLFIS